MKRLLFVHLLLSCATLDAQSRITTPKEEFGAKFGDDYVLANYRQIATYWREFDGRTLNPCSGLGAAASRDA